jgi:hypothetical protein
MRRFSQARYSLFSGFALTGYSAAIVCVVLVHLSLMPAKIEFVYARSAYLERFNVARLIFHNLFLVGNASVFPSHGFRARAAKDATSCG